MESVTCSPVPYAMLREETETSTKQPVMLARLFRLRCCQYVLRQHPRISVMVDKCHCHHSPRLAKTPGSQSYQTTTHPNRRTTAAFRFVGGGVVECLAIFAAEACFMMEAQSLGRRKHCQVVTKSTLMLKSVRPRRCYSKVCFLP